MSGTVVLAEARNNVGLDGRGLKGEGRIDAYDILVVDGLILILGEKARENEGLLIACMAEKLSKVMRRLRVEAKHVSRWATLHFPR